MKDVIDYRVRFKGVWGRNRSVKSDSYALREDVPADAPLSDAAALALAEAHLRAIRAKDVVFTVVACPAEVEEYPAANGAPAYAVKRHCLFSYREVGRGSFHA